MLQIFLLLLSASSLFANMPELAYPSDQKIGFQNSILCKVHGNTISMMDVKKKMDLLFHQNYPKLTESNQARFQFYEASWRQVLLEMIDNELILAAAEDKEIKVSDGEVREEVESRFGPNVLITLDKIGLTYDETWKMVKNDMIVRRMMWWFVQSKAIQKVTPKEIRTAYRSYVQEHPPYTEWKYKIISIRGKNPENLASQIQALIQENKQSPDLLLEKFKEIDPSIQLSSEYTAKSTELSEVYNTILSSLHPGEYSEPVVQVSRFEKQAVARIFYLFDAADFPAPQFDELSSVLNNELQRKFMAEESTTYLEKLRKHYGFDKEKLQETLPDDLHPFSLH